MAGASWNHVVLVSNLTAALLNTLWDQGCYVLSSDMCVRVEARDLDTDPDLSVVCGEPVFLSEKRIVLLNPVLIVEVLSSSTESYDRGQKFKFYRALPSLQEYVLVAQDRINVEIFRKNDEGHWVLYETDPEQGTVELASVDCTVSLDDVYAGVTFDAAGARDRPTEGTGTA